MNPFFYIKRAIIVAGINKKKKAHPLDIDAIELHQLPQGAGPLLNNSYYFGGSRPATGESLIFRAAFRSHLSELFILYTKGDRFLVLDERDYPADGCPVKVECVEPGKKWHCTFEGEMRDTASGHMTAASFDVTFTARLPIFDSLYHGDPRGMALGFALAKWNKKFFAEAMGSDMGMSKEKKKDEQHHCEQTGHYDGTITIGGEISVIDLPGSRDHSFGRRDWNYMNDHIWLMADTEKGETFNLQLVNYPAVKPIFLGYTDIGENRNYSMRSYRILEYDHNDGLGSDVLVMESVFNNGKKYHIRAERKVNVRTDFDGGNYYFQEGIADFIINGIPARGTIEYGFNRDRSRWDSYDF